MSFALVTAWKDLRRRLRDPLGLLIWLGIPIGLGLMIKLAFGGSGGGGPRAEVLVVDQDESFLSGFLLGAMGQERGGELPFVVEVVELEEGQRRIEDGDGSALLVIPEGFAEAVLNEEPCTLRLVTNPAQRILPGMVEETLNVLVDGVFYLHRVFGQAIEDMIVDPPEGRHTLSDPQVAEIATRINQRMESLGDLLFPPVIRVELDVEEDQPDGPGFGEIFFPSLLFMTLFFLAQGISEDVWLEKEAGTLRRAVITPNPRAGFLLGKLLAAVVLVVVVSLAGLFLGRYGFGLELSNLFLATLWAGLAGCLFTALMVLLQLHARSQRGGSLLANLVMMPLLMLGGSFFPFEVMPEWMARIGRWTPNGWALVQLEAITTASPSPGDLALAFLGILAATLVLILLATRRLAAFARS